MEIEDTDSIWLMPYYISRDGLTVIFYSSHNNGDYVISVWERKSIDEDFEHF